MLHHLLPVLQDEVHDRAAHCIRGNASLYRLLVREREGRHEVQRQARQQVRPWQDLALLLAALGSGGKLRRREHGCLMHNSRETTCIVFWGWWGIGLTGT